MGALPRRVVYGVSATTKDIARSAPASKIQAARGGMAEVRLGEIASKHAMAQDVKDFAQTMIDDHSKANDELKSIATAKGVGVPEGVGKKNSCTTASQKRNNTSHEQRS